MSLSNAVVTPTVSTNAGSSAGSTDQGPAEPAAFAALLQASVAAQNSDTAAGEFCPAAPLGDETDAGAEAALLPVSPGTSWGSWPTAVDAGAQVGQSTVEGAAYGDNTDAQADSDCTGSGGAETASPVPELQLARPADAPVGGQLVVAASDGEAHHAAPGADETSTGTLADTSVDGDTASPQAAPPIPDQAGESTSAQRAGAAGVSAGSPVVVAGFSSSAEAPATASAPAAPPATVPATGPATAPSTSAPVNSSVSPQVVSPNYAAASGGASVAPPPVAAAGATGAQAAAASTSGATPPAASAPADAAAVSRVPESSASLPPVPVAPLQGMPSVAVSPAGSASPTPPAPLAAQVAPTLFTLVGAKPGEHVLTINVAPDNLGPVTVRAHVTVDSLRVELYAPTDAGRDALRAIMPDLRRDLAGTGLAAQLDLSSDNSAPGQDPRKERTLDARMRQPDQDTRGSADSAPRVHRASSASTIDVLA